MKDKGITNPIYIKAYLNITNPIYIDKDFLNWNADQVVADLDKQGIISSEDGLKILNIADLEIKNSKLREILKNKGGFLQDTVTFVLLLEWGKPVSSWQMETDELRPVLEGCFLL